MAKKRKTDSIHNPARTMEKKRKTDSAKPMEKKRKTELRRSKRISNSTDAIASLDWSKLPDDVTAKILSLTPDQPLLDILLKWLKYQRVCKTWQRVFCDRCPPMRWRTIDFKLWDAVPFRDLENLEVDKIYRCAIDRSCGQLVDITLGCETILTSRYGCVNSRITDELLDYMTERCRGIRRLCLVSCEEITNEGLRAAASRLPLLEDLQISGHFSPETMQMIGLSCPLLKSFRSIKPKMVLRNDINHDDYTIAIARTMRGLHNLELGKFKLTDNAIKEIVDRCPHLESLDLGIISNAGWIRSLLDQKLNRITKEIKKFKPPGIRMQI